MANNIKLVNNTNKNKKLKTTNDNYEKCKYNATKFGIFAKCSVMHWENKNDYDNLLKDLIKEYQPNNVTERHLIVELANTMWSKIRLKYAEKSSLQAELNKNVNGYFAKEKVEESLLVKEHSVESFNIKKAVVISDDESKLELYNLKVYSTCCDKTINILTEDEEYEKGLSALHIEHQNKWKNTWEDDGDEDTYSATAIDLLEWVNDLQNGYQKKIFELENKDKVKDQVLGSTFLPDKTMDKYIRYENHLDKKFEKTLAMFFKLREIRSNGGLSKSVL